MSTIRLSDLGIDDVGGLILASFFFFFRFLLYQHLTTYLDCHPREV